MNLGQNFVKYFIRLLGNGVSREMLLRFSDIYLQIGGFSSKFIQKQKLGFSIDKPCRDQFEAVHTFFNSGYYIVPSPITALRQRPNKSASATLLPGQK